MLKKINYKPIMLALLIVISLCVVHSCDSGQENTGQGYITSQSIGKKDQNKITESFIDSYTKELASYQVIPAGNDEKAISLEAFSDIISRINFINTKGAGRRKTVEEVKNEARSGTIIIENCNYETLPPPTTILQDTQSIIDAVDFLFDKGIIQDKALVDWKYDVFYQTTDYGYEVLDTFINQLKVQYPSEDDQIYWRDTLKRFYLNEELEGNINGSRKKLVEKYYSCARGRELRFLYNEKLLDKIIKVEQEEICTVLDFGRMSPPW